MRAFTLSSLVCVFIYSTYQYQKNKVSHKGSKKQQSAELSISAFKSTYGFWWYIFLPGWKKKDEKVGFGRKTRLKIRTENKTHADVDHQNKVKLHR